MKTRIAWAASAALLALGSTLTLAATPSACNPEGTQFELNACASDEYAAADAELNAAWRELLAALDGQPTAIARLREAQRAWIAFRDAEVAARFPVEDGEDPRTMYGSMYPMALNATLTTLTRARTAELRARLEEINDR
jgi:uncharacterized protein YecT (DUF1311 family)